MSDTPNPMIFDQYVDELDALRRAVAELGDMSEGGKTQLRATQEVAELAAYLASTARVIDLLRWTVESYEDEENS